MIFLFMFTWDNTSEMAKSELKRLSLISTCLHGFGEFIFSGISVIKNSVHRIYKQAGYISSLLQVLTQALGVSPRKSATLRTICAVLVVHKSMDIITGAGPTAGGEYHTVLVSRGVLNI